MVGGDELLVVATRAPSTPCAATTRRTLPRRVDGLGDVVAVAGLSADRETGRAVVVVDSFARPRRLAVAHRPGTAGGSATPWITVDDDDGVVPDMVVSQLSYPSLDGTTIGLFLIHRATSRPAPTCR